MDKHQGNVFFVFLDAFDHMEWPAHFCDLAVLRQLLLSMVNRMKHFLRIFWQDEQGAETAEWLVVVALIVAVAIALYTGVLQPALTAVITGISADITTL